MDTQPRSVLVVGAGIIGLVSAFRLLRDGHQVTVLDPAPARGATWAAAGMIAPSGEITPGEEANYQLQRRALPAWRSLGDELLTVTGESLQIIECGTLLVGWDASDQRLVEQFAQVTRGFGATSEECTRAGAPSQFEGLSARITRGLYLPGDAWLDPDQAVRLLLEALDLLGAKVILDEVTEIESSDHEVRARTSLGDFAASCGLLATGAARLIPGVLERATNTVRPVRGVTLRVRGLDRSDAATLRAFVRGRALYVVSRPGGYCVLGATADERGEPALEMGELQRLMRDALDVLPSLEGAEVIEHRVGFRPASRDLEPFFEPLGTSRWAWASGHYRHGVTLAPLSGSRALEFVRALS